MKTTFRGHLFMPDQVIGSVIRQIDHDGIVFKPGGFEPFQNIPDVVIVDSNGVAMLSHNIAVQFILRVICRDGNLGRVGTSFVC